MLKKQKIYPLLFILTVILPFIFSLKPIIEGAMPFWNDPARDLLLAWDNLRKLSLIGPTSGIPGIFYGPQWIWILSLGLIISKDPRVVVFLTHTIPYFLIMPLLFYRMSKNLLSKGSAIAMWLLFILSFGSYTNQIWSPNLAPLFFFCLIFVFVNTNLVYEGKDLKNYFLLGLINGLLLNHHISFGIGITFSWILYFIATLTIVLVEKQKTKKIKICNWFINSLFFGLGFLMMMSPFFLFEIRHGFMQTKSLFFTLNQGFVHNQAVVGQIGLAKSQILMKFLSRLTDLLSISNKYSLLTLVFLAGGYLYIFLKRKKTDKLVNKLLLFLIFNIVGVLIVYLTAKNPVWDYHFIGFEIIYLFLLGFLMKQNRTLEKIILIWSIILFIIATNSFIKSFQSRAIPELMTKKRNAEQIYKDADKDLFVYLAKNPAIYFYDYDYIFRWLSKKYGYKPNNFISDEKLIYLIIPYDMKFDKTGFMENRTPEEKYMTIKEWSNPDGSIIVKRRLKK